MKLLRLSLAALIGMGTCAFGADTLQDAFKNGTYTGELRLAYMAGSKSDVPLTQAITSDKDVGAVGIQFGYKTADFNNFKLGLTFQASHDLGLHGEDDSTQDDTRLSVSTASLVEAYLEYNFTSNTNTKVGKQFIYSPLVNNLTTYAFPLADSFNAITVTSKDIPQTTIQIAYIKDWYKMWDGVQGDAFIYKNNHFKDGIYSLYFTNNSLSNLTLEGQYLDANLDETDSLGDLPIFFYGGYKQYLTKATYQLPIKLIPLSIGGFYTKANYDVSSRKDTDGYGVELTTKLNNTTTLSTAYTHTSDNADLPGTIGGSSDELYYTIGLINNVLCAGMDAYSIEGRHKFSDQLGGSLKYLHIDQSAEGYAVSAKQANKADEVVMSLKYDFLGELKGLSIHTLLSYVNYDLDVDKNDILYGRAYVTYKF